MGFSSGIGFVVDGLEDDAVPPFTWACLTQQLERTPSHLGFGIG